MRNSLNEKIKKNLNTEFTEKSNAVIEKTKIQLNEYLLGRRAVFDLNILEIGTDFQKKTWQALKKIEYGKTASYLDIAKIIGNEKAVRAVANANASNSIILIIPCHRIIGSNGELTGFGGGLPVKKKLLEIEKNYQESLFF